MKNMIKKWGNDLFIRIPDIFADKIRLGEKTDIEISIEGGTLVIKPFSKLENTSDKFSKGINNDLYNHRESEEAYIDITKTRTWELCGSLEIEKPDPLYVIGYDNKGKAITNYAEHIDEILMEDTHV